MPKFGYARVSLASQDERLQVDALKRAGCTRVFIDRGVSGSVEPDMRPQFHKLRSVLTKGDSLIVWKLDRLGRSLMSIIATLDSLKAQGVEFSSVTENVDTSSPHGRAMWQMIGIFAELERETIRQRTREGMTAAIRQGKHVGRPANTSAEQLIEIRDQLQNGYDIAELASKHRLSEAVLLRRLKHQGLLSDNSFAVFEET